MKTALIACTTALLLTACAGPAPRWERHDVTPQRAEFDRYECIRDMRTARVRGLADEVHFFHMCMRAKGYHFVR